MNCEIAEVPKNLTHLFAPLDLTVNKSLKSFEQREFSKYYSDQIARQLRVKYQPAFANAQSRILKLTLGYQSSSHYMQIL